MNAIPETYSFLNSKMMVNGYPITDFATDKSEHEYNYIKVTKERTNERNS